MTLRLAARTTLATALVAGALAAASPASAESVTLADPADATASLSDIREVTVRHTTTRVHVKVEFTALEKTSEFGPSGLTIYVDTDRETLGPEARIDTGLQAGTDYQLSRANGWKGVQGDPSSCAHRLRIDFEAATVKGWVARRCLKAPDAVRVAVRMVDLYDGSHPVTDWLKGTRKFTRWVSSN